MNCFNCVLLVYALLCVCVCLGVGLCVCVCVCPVVVTLVIYRIIGELPI